MASFSLFLTWGATPAQDGSIPMNDSFKRILALARRTGDRLIVTDPEGQEAFVLLGLDQYEALLGGSTRPPAPVSAPIQPSAPVPVEAPIVPATPVPVLVSPVPEAAPAPAPQKEEEFSEAQFYLEPVE